MMNSQLSLFEPVNQNNIETASFQNSFALAASKLDFTVAEYFAGIGLVRLGLEEAGWRVAFANDISVEKLEMYASYFEDASQHYQLADIFDLEPASIPQTLLATSSFPCIDLSLAGNQNGLSGKHSSAFWGFVRVLQSQGNKRPRIVMLENVLGWLTSNKGFDFRLTIKALNDLGYACDVFTLDALHFTPQSRPRVFVIGVQTETPSNNLEQLIYRSSDLSTKALRTAIQANLDLNWHYLSLPDPPKKKDAGLNTIIEKMEVDDTRWWEQDEVERHLNMMSASHRERVSQLAIQNVTCYRTVYRRRRNGAQRAEVRKGDTAGCLRTARGGSSRQIVLEAGKHNIRMRHMTPREYARLQGVPEDYHLPSRNTQALTGFGDAVCVPVISWIARYVLNPLAIVFTPRHYESRETQITCFDF